MAIAKVADRATANSNSAVTTVDLVLSGMTVDNYLIIRTAADNSGGGGAARTCTPSNVVACINIATHQAVQQNYDPGAASAGTTLNIIVAKITATSGTVRLTYSGSVVQACVAEEWSGIAASAPIRTNGGGGGATSTTPTVSLVGSSEQVGDLFYVAAAIEGPNGDSYTEDSDTTGGSWVSLTRLGTTNATATDNQKIVGAYKIITATGTQDWTPTITSRDWATHGLVLIPGGTAHTQTVPADGADEIGITDSHSKDLGSAATDPVGITDASLTQESAAARSRDDTIGITDSPLVQESAAVRSTADDPIGITDAVVVERITDAVATDPVGITDVADQALAAGQSADDPMGITDPSLVQEAVAERSPTNDPIGILDPIVVDLSSVATEPVGVNDSLEVVVVSGRTIDDTIGIVDDVEASAGGQFDAEINDAIGLVDDGSVVSSVDYNLVGIADSIERTLSAEQIVTDPIGILDDATAVQAAQRTNDDTLGLLDTFTQVGANNGESSETVGLLDSLTVELVAQRTEDNTVGITDSVAVESAVTATDPIGLTDTTEISLLAAATDPIGLTDSISVAVSRERTVNDRLDLGDGRNATTPLLDTAAAAWRAIDYAGSGDLLDLTGNGHDLTITGATFATDRFVFSGNPANTHYLTSTTRPQHGENDITVVVVYRLGTWQGLDGGWGYLVDGTGFFDHDGYQILITGDLRGAVWSFDGSSEYPAQYAGTDPLLGLRSIALRAAFATAGGIELLVDGSVVASYQYGYEDSLDGPYILEFGRGVPGDFHGAAVFDGLLTDAEVVQARNEILGLGSLDVEVTSQREITDLIGLVDDTTADLGATQTVTDTVGLTDTITVDIVAERTHDDTVGLTDNIAVVVAAEATVTDLVGITDDAAAALSISHEVSDLLGIQDDESLVSSIERDATDTLGLTDTFTQQGANNGESSDTIGLTDAILVELTAARTITDAVGIVDDTTTATDTQVTITDPIGLLDAAAVETALTITDPLGLSDSLTQAASLQVEITNTFEITDDLANANELDSTVNDLIGLVDSIQTSVDISVTLTDDLVVADDVSAARSIVLTVDDFVGITDVADDSVGFVVTVVDGAGVLDSTEIVQTHVSIVTDNIGNTDSTSSLQASERLIDDQVQISDALASENDLDATVIEFIGLLDEVEVDFTSGAINYSQTVNDNLGLADSIAAESSFVGDRTDPVGITDSIAVAASQDSTHDDTVGLTDEVLVALSIAATLSDGVGVEDSQERASEMSVTAADIVGALDELTIEAEFYRLVDDLVPVTDTPVSGFGTGIEIVEQIGILDAATADKFIAAVIRIVIALAVQERRIVANVRDRTIEATLLGADRAVSTALEDRPTTSSVQDRPMRGIAVDALQKRET